MRRRNRFYQTIGWILCVLLATVAVLPVAAAESAAPAQPYALRILFRSEETPVSGVPFRIYRIADADDGQKWKLADPFDRYPVSLEGLTEEEWGILARTLAAYVARDAILADREGVTNFYGGLSFEAVKPGLYLVIGDYTKVGDWLYKPQPYVVAVPGRGEDGAVLYEVTTAPKFERSKTDEEPSSLTLKAVKQWKNAAGTNRPVPVTVQLLRNGTVYDEVTLQEENHWEHVWTDLAVEDNWQVTEKNPPEHCTVQIDQDGITVLVINTFQNTETPTPAPSTPPGTTPPYLPQTGQLWWPIPVLLLVGILFFVIGGFWIGKRKDRGKKDDEKDS